MNINHAQFLMEKTRQDYDEIAEEFSATRKTMWPELADLDKYVKEGDKVLDVGCGNGKLFGFLAEKKKIFSYAGLDVSEKLIEIADSFTWRPNLQKEVRPPSIEFKLFDGIDIPYPENSFGIAFCLATLPHVPGEELRIEFLKNIRKAVKPGGLLIITCWNLWQAKFLKYQLKSVFNFITDKIFGNGLPRYPSAANREQLFKKETNTSIFSRLLSLGNGDRYDWGDFYVPWHKRNGKIIDRYYHSFTLEELKSLLTKASWKVEELGYKKRHKAKNFNLFIVAKK